MKTGKIIKSADSTISAEDLARSIAGEDVVITYLNDFVKTR